MICHIFIINTYYKYFFFKNFIFKTYTKYYYNKDEKVIMFY